MNLKPLHDRIIIQRVEEEEKTAGGIIIPDAAKEKPARGKVIAAGEGKVTDNGVKVAMNVKVGDEVLFGKYAGTEVSVDGVDYLIVRQDDVFGVID